MKKLNQRDMLSATVSALMTLMVCQSISVQASDIEIYSLGFTANPVVMFALDNSGSMSGANTRRAFDLKDSMQAVLLGEGAISPARDVLAGLSTFESVRWYPLYSGNASTNATIPLYYTAVHPTTSQVEQKTSIKVPRQNAGYIASPVQKLNDGIVYPSTRQDIFPSNGDVVFKNGNSQPTSTAASEVVIDDANKKVYVRIQADIPRGATINAAYLELRSSTDNNAKNLKIRVARHNDLYAANPSITNLQTFSTGTSRSVASNVNNTYLTKIFNNATSQRTVAVAKNYYKNDNLANPMYINSMDVQAELQALITNNNNWCGMGDLVFEIARDSDTYKFFANREDRVNPQLYVDWTLTNNTSRTSNCIFADTKRSSTQQITNLGNVGAVGAMTGRQAMNLQIQRILTNTRTPSSALLAETAAYMLGNSTKPITATGAANTSIDIALNGLTTGIGADIKYISPIKKVSDYLADTSNVSKQLAYQKEQQCGQHGLYFLTDGDEDPAPTTNDLLFRSSLLGGSGTFNCSGNMGCLPAIAGSLAKKTGYTANNRSLKIQTSTVGFQTNATANTILTNVADKGDGQYTAVSGSGTAAKQAIVDSIAVFLDRTFASGLPAQVTTGSPTLPQDALNPLRIQPYGYYASFEPKPQDSTQLWAGNLNKYHVVSGELYSSDKAKKLIKTDGSLDTTATGIWGTDGMKGQLPLGITTNADSYKVANRTIYTNRSIATTSPYTATETNSLEKVNVETLFSTDVDKAIFANDPQKNYWLNLLGYNVSASDTVTLDTIMTKPELRQVGANMHSTPLLLTQEGKITIDSSGNLDTTSREDYLLFGTTQGLLHVVKAGKSATDADRGKEVFTFVPNEMMVNQREAFLSGGGASAGGAASLFYGIDAPWTAYTQYVAKNKDSNGNLTLTVNDSGRVTESNIALKGLQWVYGGLRMGGKSYYALDLSDITNPNLKFHIDPASSKIYKSSSTTTGVTALSYMGQSWSKPTLAYVKFGGVKKLVMFVGGGYDTGYENAAYDQGTTTQGGAGVYMFDANTGDLLWWTSANATTDGGAEAYTDASASTINMKYSVVSQINAIDRDNDGLVDHLYFGDLGGQAFRVDINNAATGATASDKKDNFITRVVRLFNAHDSAGASPRFYEMPSFSIHEDTSGYVGAVAFSSGNRSSPLSGAAGTNQAGLTNSANDGVFVVYDKDVARTDLYTLIDSGTTALRTKNISLTSLNDNFSTGVAVEGNSGWKYSYSSTNGRYKGMNGLYALDGILFVNVYDRDGTGISGADICAGGVKGDSYVYQFCLPTGKCSFYTDNTTGPNRAILGGGILGTSLGQGRSNGNTTGLIVNRPTTLNCITSPNLPECQEFTTTAKLRQLRWYETR
ncbi:pilus assembly protein [Acinetobacter towneri]|uniref:hypothetical protein n=1 Tax=Acinetobacter towneri TaxID=202956 RepID=UPI002B25EC99|nr:hypothetical protein [Acinetobacter towneri]WPC31868.1 PilC/PilY family type IV pilus protein [Acinetobacter towneri]